MAFSINQVFLVGNLSSDPELRYTPGGNAVCNFSMATNRSIKQNEEWQDVPTFHKIVLWGKLGEWLAQNAHKGDKVTVTGRIDNRSYEDKDGTKKYISEIVADNIITMGGKRTSSHETQETAEDIDVPDDFGESQTPKEGKKDEEDIPF